jgi:hypothetical protein
VCSTFGAVDSDCFTGYQIGIFQKTDKQFEQFFQSLGIVFSKI